LVAPKRSPATPASETRPPSEPRVVLMVVGGAVTPREIAALCRRVSSALERDRADVVLCDVGALERPDLTAVDALARLQLTARRAGGHIRLLHAGDRLRELLDLVGLDGAVPLERDLALEARGKTEEREEVGRVEKESDS
jgi:ABC-type transporter Mla MlaB component